MRARHPKLVTASCLAAAAALLLVSGSAAAVTRMQGVTVSNPIDGVSEFRPRLRGDALVWQRGSGVGSEVMRWNGNQSINMTNNGVADENPETDGIHVVWQQGAVGQRNIAIYDLLTGTSTVLSASGDEIFPVVSGTTLGWIKLVDVDGEVFVDPGPLGNQITGNLLVESGLTIEGGNMLWVEGDDLHQTVGLEDDLHDIAVWNGLVQDLYILGAPGVDDIHPAIAGDVVVWQAGPDGSGDIWYGDIFGTANLLFAGSDERNPHTDGKRVVWEHFDGLDFDLYVVDLASPNAATPFTSDSLDDVTPQIDGDMIVWVKLATPGDAEIWYSRGGAPPQPLTSTQNNGRDDIYPRLDGERFVYESCVNLGELNELCDVVLVPEARTTLSVAVALATLGLLALRSARRATAIAQLPQR